MEWIQFEVIKIKTEHINPKKTLKRDGPLSMVRVKSIWNLLRYAQDVASRIPIGRRSFWNFDILEISQLYRDSSNRVWTLSKNNKITTFQERISFDRSYGPFASIAKTIKQINEPVLCCFICFSIVAIWKFDRNVYDRKRCWSKKKTKKYICTHLNAD